MGKDFLNKISFKLKQVHSQECLNLAENRLPRRVNRNNNRYDTNECHITRLHILVCTVPTPFDPMNRLFVVSNLANPRLSTKVWSLIKCILLKLLGGGIR